MRTIWYGLWTVLAVGGAVAAPLNSKVEVWGGAGASIESVASTGPCGEGAKLFQAAPSGPPGSGSQVLFDAALRQGVAYQFEIEARSPSVDPVVLDLMLRRNAAPYDASVAVSSRVGSEWKRVVLRGVYVAPDAGAVRMRTAGAVKGICFRNATLVEVARQSIGKHSPGRVDQSFFGIHLNGLGRHSDWPAFGPGLLRIWDAGTTWADLWGSGSSTAFSGPRGRRLDLYVSHALKHNAGLVYTLAMTPPQARLPGSIESCGNNPYAPSACAEPNIDDWRRFVGEVGAKYRGKIRVWELWNEYDYWVNWRGSPQRMVQMARVARETLKAIDPANQLIGPNVTAIGLGKLNDFLREGGGAYVDGLSVHAYFGRDPVGAAAVISNVIEMQTLYGLSLPVWNTETNLSCSAATERCGTGASRMGPEAALIQGYLLAAAAGSRAVIYYTWEGASTNAGGMGLVGTDMAPNSVGKALRQVKELLQGSRVRIADCGPELLCVSVEKSDGRSSLVVWSADGGFSPLPKAYVDRVVPLEGLGDAMGGKVSAIPVLISN